MAKNLDFSQQELFTQAFKYAPIGMALVSTEGDWLHVNSSLCQTLGYSESEFLDRTFLKQRNWSRLLKIMRMRF
jgi:PAS domain S-box-containing protein